MNQQTDSLVSQQVSSIALQQQQQAELPASQQASNVALQQQQVVLPSSHQAMVPLAQTSHQQHIVATTSERAIAQQAVAQQAMASNQHTLQLNSAGQSQQSSVPVQTVQSIAPPIVTQQPFAPMAQPQANVTVHQSTQSTALSGVTEINQSSILSPQRVATATAAGGISVAITNQSQQPEARGCDEDVEMNNAADIMYRTVRVAMRGMQRIKELSEGQRELLFPALKSQITLLDQYRQRVYDSLDKLEPSMTYAESARLESDLLDIDEMHSDLVMRISGLMEERLVTTPISSNSSNSNQSSYTDWEKEMRHFQIEQFGGDFLKWPKFKELFETFVHNNERRTPASKFLMLDHSLVVNSEATATISGLERAGENYEAAWANLCRTYDNPLKLVEDATDRFLDLPPVRGPTRQEVMAIINGVNHLLASMPKYGVDTKHWDVLLVQLIKRKLDNETVRRWTYERPMRDIPKLAPFLDYLRKISESIESKPTAVKKAAINAAAGTAATGNQRTNEIGKRVRPPIRCPMCSNEHHLYSCTQFRALTTTDRQDRVKRWSLCRNCLKRNCSPDKCTLRACTKCNVKHNGLLCTAATSQPSTNTSVASSNNITE